ncbi:MAG: DUF4097 family beta strand repeat-containing protein [Chloroflexi bacterium]|nr:DUF4097 family beta strand repeat-containing protein [Chloroflexota bacterium]
MDGKRVVFGRKLGQPPRSGALPGTSKRPALADLRLVVGDDTTVELLDFTGRATVTAVQGVILRGGKVQAAFSNLGDGGLVVEVQSGQVSVDGAGGVCTLALGDATLAASQLSCANLNADSRGDLSVQDANALGNVRLTSVNGAVSLARIRADRVAARSERGAVSLTDATVDGPLEVASQSGGVFLTRLGVESLVAAVESGTVELEDVRGALDIRAPDEVLLRRISADRLRVAGGGGAVQMSGTLMPRGTHEIRTKGGDITVYLPKETSLALDADAGQSTVITDPAFETPGGRGRLQERINGGQVPLTLESGGGMIRLLTGQPVF